MQPLCKFHCFELLREYRFCGLAFAMRFSRLYFIVQCIMLMLLPWAIALILATKIFSWHIYIYSNYCIVSLWFSFIYCLAISTAAWHFGLANAELISISVPSRARSYVCHILSSFFWKLFTNGVPNLLLTPPFPYWIS